MMPRDLRYDFFTHVGARIGSFEDGPTSSVVVESGWRRGVLYQAAVLSPTAASPGSIRIDAVIANHDTGTIQLVEGVEGSGLPDLSSYESAAAIAYVYVVGRTDGLVLIESHHITDARQVLSELKEESAPTVFQMVSSVILRPGHASQPVGSRIGPFIVRKAWAGQSRTRGLKVGITGCGMDVQLVNAQGSRAQDYHLVIQPYGMLFEEYPTESNTVRNWSDCTWYPVKPDVDFSAGEYATWGANPMFRIEAAAGTKHNNKPFRLYNRNSSGALVVNNSATPRLHVQLWLFGSSTQDIGEDVGE